MKVEIINVANLLKKKVGVRDKTEEGQEGFIDPKAIAEADKLIEELCADCTSSIGGFLKELTSIWKKMRDMEASEQRKELSQELFTQAHEIKDISSMCGYDLIAYFSESLRDYVAKTELSLDAQRVIIQAHVDAITVAHNKGLKESGGPAADELKKLVKVAIDKYS